MIRLLALVLACPLWCCLAHPAAAEEPDVRQSIRDSVRTWARIHGSKSASSTPTRLRRSRRRHADVEFRAGASHQFATDLDDGGRMSVNRFVAQARVEGRPSSGAPVAASLTYGLHAHRFTGQGTTFPARPWADVHMLKLTVPYFFDVGRRWSVRTISEIRTVVEDGASLGDGVAGGGIYGAAYRVNRCLRIGPGIGVFSQIEDDPLVFPFAFIEWQIRPDLLLRTGRGLTATQGFGVFLEWTPCRPWRFVLGGRAERLRFRLDDRGVAPDGVGEHTGTAAFLAVTRRFRNIEWTISVGATFSGELRVEDLNGSLIAKDKYDVAGYLAADLEWNL